MLKVGYFLILAASLCSCKKSNSNNQSASEQTTKQDVSPPQSDAINENQEFLLAFLGDPAQIDALDNDSELGLTGSTAYVEYLENSLNNSLSRPDHFSFKTLEEVKNTSNSVVESGVKAKDTPNRYQEIDITLDVGKLADNVGKHQLIVPAWSVDAFHTKIHVADDFPVDFTADNLQVLYNRLQSSTSGQNVSIDFSTLTPERIATLQKILQDSGIPYKLAFGEQKNSARLVIKKKKFGTIYRLYQKSKETFFSKRKRADSDSSSVSSQTSRDSISSENGRMLTSEEVSQYKMYSGLNNKTSFDVKAERTDNASFPKGFWDNWDKLTSIPVQIGSKPSYFKDGKRIAASDFHVIPFEGKRYFVKTIDSEIGLSEYQYATLPQSEYATKCYGYRKADDGRVALLFEYVPGNDLYSGLKDASLEMQTAFNFKDPNFKANIKGLAEYMEEFHAQDLAFNDWKTDNLLLRKDGKIIVIDTGSVAKSGTTPIAGRTDFYVPRNPKNDLSDDLYAFSASITEMLAKKPIDQIYGEIAAKIDWSDINIPGLQMRYITQAEHPKFEAAWTKAMGEYIDSLDITEAQKAFAKKGMSTDPSVRFQNIGELKASLDPLFL